MEELSPDLTNGQTKEDNVAAQPAEDVSGGIPGSLPVPSKKMTLLNGFSAVFNGLGIGLLLGMLLGLSVSPVVSGVVATLSGLLAILIGVNEKYLDPLKSLRIGAFGIFAVAGILLGLYLRANDPFAPSLLDRKNEYVAIGYSDEEARAFITKSVEADTGSVKRKAHVLYASEVNVGACDVLYYAQESQSTAELVNTFSQAGGVWKELAVSFENDLPGAVVGKALLTIRDCFCGSSSSGLIKMTNLGEVRKLGNNDDVEKIEKVLSSSESGENWQVIVKKVRENFSENERKAVYLSVIKVLSHD